MPEAVPLITVESTTQTFVVNPHALQLLSTFSAPLAVVSITGLFRTGKSFLLNRIILHVPTTGRRARRTAPLDGFNVDNTVQACTKGIWMWSEPMVMTNSAGVTVNVVVLDTEGSGAPTADATHDARISSLSLLLSSYFVYNSVGRIDDSALSTLSVVTRVTAEMRTEDTNELPGFLWVLRDFALQLTTTNGSSTDADTYMEEQLAGDKNDARTHLRTFFPDRGCATLIRPVVDETNLQSLNRLGDHELRPEFLEAALQLRTRILTATSNRPMRHNDVMVTGSMLGALAVRYVDAVNAGAVPHVADAWESICVSRAAEAEQAMLTLFTAAVAAAEASAATDYPPLATFRAHLQAQLEVAWSKYTESLSLTQPRTDLRDLLQERIETTLARYDAASSKRIHDAAATMVTELIDAASTAVDWPDFWNNAQSRLQGFEQTYGRTDSTRYIMLCASQRLWDVVPSFIGHHHELETQANELRHEIETLTVRLQGADRRAECLQQECDEMTRMLTRAQEEVRGMTEEVIENTSLRAEIESMRAHIVELEDAVSLTEDTAARKAAETNAAALNTVQTMRELRDADTKRHEHELAELRTVIGKLQADHDGLLARVGVMNSLQQQLADANVATTALNRELRTREDAGRVAQMRITELEKQVAEADERARKRPRVGDGESIALVRAETELGFLRTQKNELATALANTKTRCTDLERQIRLVQRTADEQVQRARLEHATELAKMEMRLNKKE